MSDTEALEYLLEDPELNFLQIMIEHAEHKMEWDAFWKNVFQILTMRDWLIN